VIGRSNIVGKPQALMLLAAGATVTVCHSRTPNPAHHLKQADIIVAAIGQPLWLKADMVKIERGDGVSLLRRANPGSLQLIFLDPPYESTAFEAALKAAAQAIATPGFVYLEAPQPWTDDELAAFGLKVHRFGKAGAVHFHLLVKTPQTPDAPDARQSA
jgi:16S rRNA G966 N2-methylase RsmD